MGARDRLRLHHARRFLTPEGPLLGCVPEVVKASGQLSAGGRQTLKLYVAELERYLMTEWQPNRTTSPARRGRLAWLRQRRPWRGLLHLACLYPGVRANADPLEFLSSPYGGFSDETKQECLEWAAAATEALECEMLLPSPLSERLFRSVTGGARAARGKPVPEFLALLLAAMGRKPVLRAEQVEEEYRRLTPDEVQEMTAYAEMLQASGRRTGRAQAEDILQHLAHLRSGQSVHES
jgi:hypothetical protein